MAELSKTARASQVREVKEVRVETPEESIRQLRLNLAAGLYVTPDRIRVLLGAYDAQIEALGVLKQADDIAMREMELKIKNLEDTLDYGQQAYNALMEKTTPGTIIEQMIEPLCPGVVMAEIPAREEDSHHLVDFGHHNTHSVAEGA